MQADAGIEADLPSPGVVGGWRWTQRGGATRAATRQSGARKGQDVKEVNRVVESVRRSAVTDRGCGLA